MKRVPEHTAKVRFVLCEPGHPGNIGMAARAIKTMGFRDLRVVNPREPDYKTDEEAVAFATSSVDVLESAVTCSSLSEALEGVGFAWALTGYDREFGPKLEPLRPAARKSADFIEGGFGEIAFVFGTERTGLSNEEILECQGCAAILADPESPSLNLSQAVQLTAYEMQMALLEKLGRDETFYDWQERFSGEEPATHEMIEGFFGHFEEAAVSCGALDPERPKNFMPIVRRLFGRSGLTRSEVDLLRGVCASVILPKSERAGMKKPRGGKGR